MKSVVMEKLELEIYSQAVNQGIVKMPGRRYPGIVIQGDTMSSLASTAKVIYELAKMTPNIELTEEASDLKDRLDGYLAHYESVLGEHDIELPYFKKTS